jgi:hypothetical protein
LDIVRSRSYSTGSKKGELKAARLRFDCLPPWWSGNPRNPPAPEACRLRFTPVNYPLTPANRFPPCRDGKKKNRLIDKMSETSKTKS